MHAFPYISLPVCLVLLRILTAALFMAHALMRIANGTIPRFSEFMGTQGFPFPSALVWAITGYEIIGGVLLMVGYKTRFVAIGQFLIALGGIALIHRHAGWFVGEHGTGGSEYSVLLMAALLVMAAADKAGIDRLSR